MQRSNFVRERKLGEFTIILPEPPVETEIANYDLEQPKQKWKPSKIPADFDRLPYEQQLAFIKKELKIREEGFWFYNNGNIEYLTGIHYFYLTYWHLPEGLPRFTDGDRDFFYLWDYCVKDPQCFGLLDIENRRGGKTAKSTCILYEYASKTKNVQCGIQSKTNGDGKAVFNKLKASWKKLHSIWKPTDTGETNPASALRFEEPSVKSSKGVKKIYKDVLNSYIDYQPSVEEAYDGYPLHRLFVDEFGKSVEINVATRWNIQKFCLINPYSDSGTDIIGKAIFTTTIEELEKKGGKNAKALWENSNPNDRGADGRTKTGLYRYFKPANYGHAMFMDEYGYSDKEGAKKYLLRQREGLTGNALFDLMRKQPLTIEEAFISSDKSDIFPAYKIYEQIKYNETIYEPLYRVGNFIWVDEEQKQVQFFDDANGRWKVSWLLPENLQNAKEVRRNGIAPANKTLGLLGVDPYDHSTTVGDRKSNAAMYLFRTFDPLEPLRSKCFVLEYINRPATVEILYDDVIKTAVYYGVEVFAETQKPGLINAFERRGFGNYIKKINHSDVTKNGADKEHKGLSTSGVYVRESLMSNTVTYIYENIGKLSMESQQKRGIAEYNPAYHGFCPFNELLEQWLDFDVNDWTKYDAVVASSIAILGTTNLRAQKPKKQPLAIDDFFKSVKLR